MKNTLKFALIVALCLGLCGCETNYSSEDFENTTYEAITFIPGRRDTNCIQCRTKDSLVYIYDFQTLGKCTEGWKCRNCGIIDKENRSDVQWHIDDSKNLIIGASVFEIAKSGNETELKDKNTGALFHKQDKTAKYEKDYMFKSRYYEGVQIDFGEYSPSSPFVYPLIKCPFCKHDTNLESQYDSVQLLKDGIAKIFRSGEIYRCSNDNCHEDYYKYRENTEESGKWEIKDNNLVIENGKGDIYTFVIDKNDPRWENGIIDAKTKKEYSVFVSYFIS